MYIHIHIDRERERDRYMYVYIYIYIDIYRERERERRQRYGSSRHGMEGAPEASFMHRSEGLDLLRTNSGNLFETIIRPNACRRRGIQILDPLGISFVLVLLTSLAYLYMH